ncbi:meiosis-specific APC/C activator protein Ama1p [Monosporozyma unispora]|nr:hypothetical protein C6P44_005205 [Kazachstania unispora]
MKILQKERKENIQLMDRFIPQLTSKEAYNCKTTVQERESTTSVPNNGTIELEEPFSSPSPERFSSPDILFNNNSMDHYNSIGQITNNTTVIDECSTYITSNKKQNTPSSLHNNHIAKSLGFNHWDTRVYKYGNHSSPHHSHRQEDDNETTPLRRPNKRLLKSHIPYRVLDAPCLRNDFYSNLISWSHTTGNILVGLGCSVYIWSTRIGARQVLKHEFLNKRNDYVTCVSFAPKGSNRFVVGTKHGWLYLFDQTRLTDLPTNGNNDEEFGTINILDQFHSKSMKSITCLEWLNESLACQQQQRTGFIFGEENGYINLVILLDGIIAPRLKLVERFKAQSQQVCGISLNYNNQQIAVGGNDNSCSLWDISNFMSNPVLRFKFHHNAAIKAVAFCPWSKSLLATGGGTKDKIIKFWHTGTGTLINQINTENQITSLVWSKHHKQIVATFGFGDLKTPLLLTLYNYPTLEPILQVQTPHPLRALSSAISPDGSSICVATTDETIRFYELWDSKDELLIKEAQDFGIYGSSLIEHLEGIDYHHRGRSHTIRNHHLR